MMKIGAGGLGFGLFGGLGPVPFVLSQASRASAASTAGRILVVFEWFGGNDGLNTIVPYGDPMYYRHRPTIGIRETDLLPIDAHLGWHRSMGGMRQLYDEGKVAIVQGVGYDQPSFSHFTSMSFWHTAAPNSGNEYGWIGRTASAIDPEGGRANLIVNIADSQTLAVKAKHHVRSSSSIRCGSSAEAVRPGAARRRHARIRDVAGRRRAPLRARGDAQRGTGIRGGARGVAPLCQRASDLPPRSEDKVVALIQPTSPRLYYVPLRGGLFDTHVNQASPHDRQLQCCSDAIAGFFREMERIGRPTI
ncbi:MAG: hypothetical protein R2712_29850 [Vicinamibacterales bacterium]